MRKFTLYRYVLRSQGPPPPLQPCCAFRWRDCLLPFRSNSNMHFLMLPVSFLNFSLRSKHLEQILDGDRAGSLFPQMERTATYAPASIALTVAVRIAGLTHICYPSQKPPNFSRQTKERPIIIPECNVLRDRVLDDIMLSTTLHEADLIILLSRALSD